MRFSIYGATEIYWVPKLLGNFSGYQKHFVWQFWHPLNCGTLDGRLFRLQIRAPLHKVKDLKQIFAPKGVYMEKY